eukprot:430189_1
MQHEQQQSSDSSHNIPNDANGQTNDSSDEGEEDGEVYHHNNNIDSTLLEWIKVNKLTFIKEILLQQEISLTEIAALSHHQRRQFVDSLQIENPIFEKRLLNAVLLLNEGDNDKNDNNYMNNGHNNIENIIQKKEEYIDNSIKNANDCMELLQIQMRTNEKKIEEIYNEVIVAANKYKKIALDTTSQIYDMKFSILGVKLNKFKEMRGRIIEYKESGYKYNDNERIDDILSCKECENIMDMIQNTDIIQYKIGRDDIDEYICNILHINDINSMILSPKINITDIEKDCISIHILSDINNDYDLNVTKYEIKYYQVYEEYDKIINGHKYNSEIINFNMDKIHKNDNKT